MAKGDKKSTETKSDVLVQELKLKTAEALLKEREAEYKNLEVVEKAIDIDEKRVKNKEVKFEIEMNKIRLLSGILTYCQIDEEGTTIGSEPKLKHIFSENEKDLVKSKLFNIINKL